MFFALSTTSTLQPLTGPHSSSGNRCPRRRCRSSTTSRVYNCICADLRRSPRSWCKERYVERCEQRLISRCSGTNGDGHVSTPTEGFEGTHQERAWTDTMAAAATAAATVMHSRDVNGVRIHDGIGVEDRRSWQSPRSGDVNEEEQGIERCDTATVSIVVSPRTTYRILQGQKTKVIFTAVMSLLTCHKYDTHKDEFRKHFRLIVAV